MSRRLLSLIAVIFWCSGPASAQNNGPIFAGEWDVFLDYLGGSSAGRMTLAVDTTQIKGASDPLDSNGYSPLTITGTAHGASAELRFWRSGQTVGELTVDQREGALQGRGELYGAPVRVHASRSVIPVACGESLTYAPKLFQMTLSDVAAPVLVISAGDDVLTTTADNEGRGAEDTALAMPGNPLTGPFYVRGAMPGDTLVVHLKKVAVDRSTARMNSGKLAAQAVPSGYAQEIAKPSGRGWVISPDRTRARPAEPSPHLKTLQVPVRAMIGTIGVAPPANQSVVANDLGVFGGNLDYNRYTAGTTVYLPVFRAGALLSLGDGHAAQGAGEVSGQGLETSLEVEFSVDVIKAGAAPAPWAENGELVMMSGVANSLDDALKAATANMATWLKRRYDLSDSDVTTLLGSSLGYEVAEVVDPRPHVVATLTKDVLNQIWPGPQPLHEIAAETCSGRSR